MVCLRGAVFAGTLECPTDTEIDISTDQDKALYVALEALPAPADTEFNDWKKLDAHLVSLAARATELRDLGL